MITKAIIPVAGYGTRFLPVTKAMPKEMLPVVDKPVIQYVVEEAVASGMTDISFVTGRGKRAIEDHFDVSYELEETLAARERRELLELVERLPELARFTYVRQQEPLGNGDAVARARHLIADDEAFAVLFGDDIVDSTVPALKQLVDTFSRYGNPVLALSRVPKAAISRYGTVAGRRTEEKYVWEIDRIIEKPTGADIPKQPLAVLGRYILTPDIFTALDTANTRIRSRRRRAGARLRGRSLELGLTDGISEMLKRRPVYGVEITGDWYDCGSKAGFLAANISFAAKRQELRKDVRALLWRFGL